MRSTEVLKRELNFVKIGALLMLFIGCSNMAVANVDEVIDSEEVSCEIPEKPAMDIPDVSHKIWPGDTLQIFVWQNPELSLPVLVRPDGRISIPLVEELDVDGANPADVARAIEEELTSYIKTPLVTVIVTGLSSSSRESVRIIGGAVKPIYMRYYKGMTLLDLIVAQGGLNEYAAGNRAELIREVCGQTKSYPLRIDDLIDGQIENNIPLQPGDIVVIPESLF